MKKLALFLLCGVWISFLISVFFTFAPYIDQNAYLVNYFQIIQWALLVGYFLCNIPLAFEISGLEHQPNNLVKNVIFSLVAVLLVRYEFNSFILTMLEIFCLVGCSLALHKIYEIDTKDPFVTDGAAHTTQD